MSNVKDLRNVGYNPVRMRELRERNAAESARSANRDPDAPVDKTGWFNLPTSFEKWNPTKPGYYTFDVLQMHMKRDNYEMRKVIGQKTYNEAEDVYWFERSVVIHSAFPRYLPCENNFGVEIVKGEDGRWFPKSKDAVCSYIRDNYPAVKPSKINSTYSIMMLRMHPNKDLGIDDYKFVFYIDTVGKFANMLYDEYKQMIDCDDIDENAFFANWGKFGKSIKARFANLEKELPSDNGGTVVAKWIGCNKIDFIERKDQLTDGDIEMLSKIEVDDCIYHPTQEEFDTLAAKISGKIAKPVKKVEVYEPETPVPTARKENEDLFDDEIPMETKEEDDDLPW